MTVKTSTRLARAVSLPVALTLALTAPVFAHAADSDSGRHDRTYRIALEPLNDSGARGTATLTLDGRQLKVTIDVRGLAPGLPHAQHIHGSTDGHDHFCPDMSADTNKDGVLTTAEGLPAYGDINISLTTKGDTTKASGLAVDRMPVADENGALSYSRTIAVSQAVADHIEDLHVVQHGIDPNGNGRYDFGKGKSELDPKLPQEATAPATCGMIKGTTAHSSGAAAES
ncbi:CHRD domain-containing protein [Streptomyces sp. NPDC006339]|uniref:CHRD domain-containing protein n=1 Tax=Streptomyces sp. NPDC006339 TaxID=3156755 RepID=UPI0033AEA090